MSARQSRAVALLLGAERIVTGAGLAAGCLAMALKDESQREAALITFLVTLSGVVIGGIGSAFWGVVVGSVALFVQQYGSRKND